MLKEAFLVVSSIDHFETHNRKFDLFQGILKVVLFFLQCL